MSFLTEQEIKDCLKDNLRQAIQHCTDLATKPKRGLSYDALRTELGLIEGCCTQMAYWRSDTRWLQFGLLMEQAHQRAGEWLRRHHPKKLFLMLGENLKVLLLIAEDLETKKTGIMGSILPMVQAGPHRENRPISVPRSFERRSAGGIIIPDGASV